MKLLEEELNLTSILKELLMILSLWEGCILSMSNRESIIRERVKSFF